jgi:hypothetical protein
MNKSQIRLLLEKESIKVSTTRIGEVAVSLGVESAGDSYGEQDTKMILDSIRADYQKAKDLKQPAQPEAPQSPQHPPLPTDESRALIKQTMGQSSEALTGQVQALTGRMDASDRTLAQQLAVYVADRPNRFTVMFAQELKALMAPQQKQPQTFVDVELGVVEMPDLMGNFRAIATSTPMGCLPM